MPFFATDITASILGSFAKTRVFGKCKRGSRQRLRRQAFASLAAPAVNDGASCGSRHASQKAMPSGTTNFTGLIGSFHRLILSLSQNKRNCLRYEPRPDHNHKIRKKRFNTPRMLQRQEHEWLVKTSLLFLLAWTLPELTKLKELFT